jgi:plasmid stabilization system protein ParE
LEDAVSFVSAESPHAAWRLLGKVLDAAQSLTLLSTRGRIVPERDDPAIRELLIDPYRLIYVTSEAQVVVLALLHQRRDWSDPDRDAP